VCRTDILDGLSAHIAILDADGVILAVNQAWRAFAAANPPVTVNVCEGANYLTVCDGAVGEGAAEAARAAAAIRSVLAGEQAAVELEYACHSPSAHRWFTARITRFPGDGHARIIIAHENITHRVQAERALSTNENALRRSQAVAHVGHWTWDTRTNVVTWSDEMKRIFGLDPAQCNGDLDAVIERSIHPDDRARVLALNEAVIHNAQPIGAEYRVIWSDGQVRTVWAQPGDREMDDAGPPGRPRPGRFEGARAKRLAGETTAAQRSGRDDRPRAAWLAPRTDGSQYLICRWEG
jgi:PAS domain-containing protein